VHIAATLRRNTYSILNLQITVATGSARGNHHRAPAQRVIALQERTVIFHQYRQTPQVEIWTAVLLRIDGLACSAIITQARFHDFHSVFLGEFS
jgi:hypothetical protein